MKPYVWPIKGKVTQGFGPSSLAVEPDMFALREDGIWVRCRPLEFPNSREFKDFHPGLDIACPIGTPVRAPDDGVIVDVVEYTIFNPFLGRKVTGLYVAFRYFIDAKTQRYLLVDHLSDTRPEGTKVAKGGTVAKTGNSGASSGPHAHMETRSGTAKQPLYPSAKWFRLNPNEALK